MNKGSELKIIFQNQDPLSLSYLYELYRALFAESSSINLLAKSSLSNGVLIEAIKEHRLEGILLNSNLRELLPSELRIKIESLHFDHILAVNRMLNEMMNLTSLLNQIGIDHIYFKGPLMAKQLYGTLFARGEGDIDILFEEHNLSRILACLTQQGWTISHPNIGIRQLANPIFREAFTFFFDEIPLHRNGIDLDLHWRIAQGKHGFVETKRLIQDRENIELAANLLPCLSESYLPLLCAHTAYWDEFRELRHFVDFRFSLAQFGANEYRTNFRFGDDLISFVSNQISLWEKYMENANQILLKNDFYSVTQGVFNRETVSIPRDHLLSLRDSLIFQLLRKRHFGSGREILLYLLYRITIRPAYKLFQFARRLIFNFSIKYFSFHRVRQR